MKKDWIKYLCDPIDKTDLVLTKVLKGKGSYVLSGELKSISGNKYVIKNGVPILTTNKVQKKNTVDSFAFEWNSFDFEFGKKGWIEDVVVPVVDSVKYFKNKTIIDCGAGSGRQSLWFAQAGAKFVFSIELSDAATTIVKSVTNRYKDKIFVIQADIANLPIKNNLGIDIGYCVNVIQHTKNPKKTFKEIVSVLNKKSFFIFNIYMKKGRERFLNLLDRVRSLTKFIPNSLLRTLTFVVTIACFSITWIPGIGGWLNKSLPISHGFKETWLAIYDILGSHTYQKFYSEAWLKNLFVVNKVMVVKRSKYVMLLKI